MDGDVDGYGTLVGYAYQVARSCYGCSCDRRCGAMMVMTAVELLGAVDLVSLQTSCTVVTASRHVTSILALVELLASFSKILTDSYMPSSGLRWYSLFC